MSFLRYATLAAGAIGVGLTQILPVLPDGRTKNYLSAAAFFLSGLGINVFKPKSP
jgi:hypothetical protein